MAADTERVEPGESEEEVEDVYEVERIIDMRVEEGEVLYRVRWKNYCSDDDTWEPEAHLEDCREVLLAFKKNIAEAKSKKEAEAKKSVKVLPAKSDLLIADSDSDSDKDRPTDLPVKKKKKKQHMEEPLPKEKKKKKKKKERHQDDFRPLPAPETDEEDEPTTTPPSSPKKRSTHSEDEDEQDTVPAKKQKKDKSKEAPKAKLKAEEIKKKKGKKEVKMDTSDDDTAPIEEDISESLSETPAEDITSETLRTAQSIYLDDKFKEKKGKWEVKLQGFKNLIQKKETKKPDTSPKESSLQKLKSLTSKAKEDLAPNSSDSSDSSTAHRKSKSKDRATTPSSVSATPSTRPKEERPKEERPKEERPKEERPKEERPKEERPKEERPKEERPKEERPKEDRPKEDRPKEDRPKEDRPKEDRPKEDTPAQKDSTGSTNLFEKFLLNCEAKDRAPRRPAPPPEKSASKPLKLIGKIEKIPKSSKESPVQKADADRTEKLKQTEAVSKAGQSHGFSLDNDEKEGEFSPKSRGGDEARRERPDEGQRSGWDRHSCTPRRREDSEPRLFMACEEPLEDLSEPSDKSEKTQATLSLGMDLNLDWMTLEDFQRHLNGDDEVLSGPPLSPSELRDAVKSGDYLAVKLALNSKEDYNLDQEDGSGMSLSMLAAAGGQDDILRLLIRKGVRVNGRQKNGTTALMHAAEKNFLTTVAILLEAGAYVNAQTLGGETALMKACKRGNLDVVRLLLEYGADCNIMSKHGKNTAMYFAKLGNNLMVGDLIKDHTSMLCSVTDEAIRAYFESRLAVLEPVFPLACHRLCEGPDFYMEFGYKLQPQPEGAGILLFIFHANFQNEITARLCGPCAVHAVRAQ
ncbi:hypothetical protein NL108_017142 [Boleophthalmus pectinirostris]|nr:hypothetical protein NL108_017142 [Boleophthalmus pectinirostris]